MDSLLEIENLTKRFRDVRAVDGVSFKAGKGEVVGFLGPNGAGKTTTMRMVAGYLPPDSGRITLCGVDVVAHPMQARVHLGYMPEGAPLYGDMTPVGLLDFVTRLRGLDKDRRKTAVALAVERLELGEVLNRPVETLSKGFKRRVGLALAIVHEPRVLVLDEPTDGLDPNQKHQVRGLIRDLAAERSIIISTHILEEVEAVCSRAVVISQGRIIEDSTPDALAVRAENHNAVVFSLDAPGAERARPLLAAAPGVAHVEVETLAGGRVRLRVLPDDPARAILPSVQEVLTRLAVQPDDLVVERGRLDDVFRRLTQAA